MLCCVCVCVFWEANDVARSKQTECGWQGTCVCVYLCVYIVVVVCVVVVGGLVR